MTTTPKRPGRSFSYDRELTELQKAMDLEAIANKTGRKPKAILNMAKRLGVSIKRWKARTD